MFNLTKITFDELVNQLLAKLQEKDAWKDANLASTGRIIIELYAYVAQLLLYYLKRSYEEMFIDSAVYWESLVKIANMLEVPVKRPYGCSGKVKLIPKVSLDSVVVIPKGTMLSCDGVSFYTTEKVSINPGDEYVVVGVRQGVKKSEEFIVPFGVTLRYDCRIVNEYASDVDVEVYVNGRQYAVVNYLLQSLDEMQAKVWTDTDKSMVVSFVKGFGLPAFGDKVEVKYYEVDFEFFPAVESMWSIEDERFRVEQVLDTFVRGSSWEDAESFRERVSKFFGVGKRAVTVEDIDKIVRSVPGVRDVKVVDVKDYFQAPFKTAIIYVTPIGDAGSPESVIDTVRQILKKVGSVGVDYMVKSVQSVDVNVYVVVMHSAVYNKAAIVDKVGKKIRDAYSKVRIGRWISRLELSQIVGSVEGVVGVVVVEPAVDRILKVGQMIRLKELRIDAVLGG